MDTIYARLKSCAFFAFASCLVICDPAIQAQPAHEVFSLGKTIDTLSDKSVYLKRIIDGKEVLWNYRIKDAIAMSCFWPSPVDGVLIRAGKCHIFSADSVPVEIRNLLVRPGDKFFRFRTLEELQKLNLPILLGQEAVDSILSDEKKLQGGTKP